jgi:hypothetical protein
MADVIGSSQKRGNELMRKFSALVASANQQQSIRFLSPATITLGDEFQAVMKDLVAGLQTIVYLEEEIVRQEADFQLRYVLHYGQIETKINTDIAYEMLGEGLSTARKALNALKDESHRFLIQGAQEDLSVALNEAFILYEHLLNRWKPEDYPLVSAFWMHKDYKKVAEVLKKDVSLMWRREKSLNLREYNAIKSVINYLGTLPN